MADSHDDLRWDMERRFEFIDFRLFWDSHVNRNDLMDTFKVSSAQDLGFDTDPAACRPQDQPIVLFNPDVVGQAASSEERSRAHGTA